MLYAYGFQQTLNELQIVGAKRTQDKRFVHRTNSSVKTLAYADDIVNVVYSNSINKKLLTDECFKQMKQIINNYQLDILPAKSKVILRTIQHQTPLVPQVTTSKLLGVPIEISHRFVNYEDLYESLRHKISNLRKKKNIIKLMPNDTQRLILNSFNNAHFTNLAPLIVDEMVKNYSLCQKFEKLFGDIFRTLNGLQFTKNRELYGFLTSNGCLISRLLEVGIKQGLIRFIQTGIIPNFYQRLIDLDNDLGPTIVSNSTWHGINGMTTKIVHDFMTKRLNKKLKGRITHFWPSKPFKKLDKVDWKQKFLVGAYDFLYDSKVICDCGTGSAIPQHITQSCPLFSDWKYSLSCIMGTPGKFSWMLTHANKPQVSKLIKMMYYRLQKIKEKNTAR